MDSDRSRQTGRTTQQILDAPQHAVYIWCNVNLSYPRALARHLGRSDLEIVGPSFLTSERWRGLTFVRVVLDHHAWDVLSDRELNFYREIKEWCSGS